MSRKNNTINEDFFLSKGYTKIGDTWHPPKLKSKFIQSLKDREKLVEKKEAKPNPDFKYTGTTTEWTIPYQMPSKKNSVQLYIDHSGRPRTTTSKRYKEYVQATKNYWEVFGREFRKSVEALGLQYPLHVEFTFTRSTKQRFDYIGIAQSAQDLMVEYGFTPDDSFNYIKPYFGDARVDKNNPSTKIKILYEK